MSGQSCLDFTCLFCIRASVPLVLVSSAGGKTKETEQRETQIQERTQTPQGQEGELSSVSTVTARSCMLVAFLSHFSTFLFSQHKKKSKKHKHKGKQKKKKKAEETDSSSDDSGSDSEDETNMELLQRFGVSVLLTV